jgi:ubiquinone/menaquinone biosynthesis C-methylase UbiE
MSNRSYFKYDNHELEWQKCLSDPDKQKLGETWFKTDTLDAWRHERLRSPLRSIIKIDTGSSWLTVGDGRYGTDAHFLLTSGAENVHCSDMSDTLLKIANEKGFIKSFSAENAESLNFDDNSFDFVYCKESFHHFPRPYIALYEMFRVARKAVILAEPRDHIVDRAPLAFALSLIKALLRRDKYQHSFEPIGNYVYSISEREIEKFLLGMHYTNVAYIGVNDAYSPGVEFIPMNAQSAKDKTVKSALLLKIRLRDFICNLGLNRSGLLLATLFKEQPSPDLLAEMRRAGWNVRELPVNPYLED